MTVAEFIAQGLLIPGDPENSRIYYRIRGSSGPNGDKNMPDDGSTTPLSTDDLTAIATWVTNATP